MSQVLYSYFKYIPMWLIQILIWPNENAIRWLLILTFLYFIWHDMKLCAKWWRHFWLAIFTEILALDCSIIISPQNLREHANINEWKGGILSFCEEQNHNRTGKKSGYGFTNVLRDTLSYENILNHSLYPILKSFEWVCNVLY